MVTCPRCGRKFKNKIQLHYCGDKSKTIDEYIAKKPEDRQPYLMQVRNAIHDAIPGAEERISFMMPAFWKGHSILHFSGDREYICIYSGDDVLKEFESELKDYKTGRGMIYIPYKEPLPLDLIARIAVWKYGMHV